MGKAKIRSLEAVINIQEDIIRITQWIQTEGWIEQFQLTSKIETAVTKKRISVLRENDVIHTGLSVLVYFLKEELNTKSIFQAN